MAASPPSAPGRIFISYRREETAFPAGWLYDRLAERFTDGQVFKDVDSIELGDDFVEVISTAVGSCDVLLALIGHQWLTITDEDGQRRLDDPNDFVRVEIEAALARNVRVIPILVEGARMPRAAELPPSLARLVRRQALELHPNRFDFDTSRLLRALERTLAEVRTAQQDAALTKTPGEAPPDSSATELPTAPEQQEQTTPTPIPTAGIAVVAAPPAATTPPPESAPPTPPPATPPPPPTPPPPRLELSATVIDFGRFPQHSQSPERRVRIANAGGGTLNAQAATQASWLRLRHVGDDLVVAVDTTAVGQHEGIVTVDSDGGAATIRVTADVDPSPVPAPQPPTAAVGQTATAGQTTTGRVREPPSRPPPPPPPPPAHPPPDSQVGQKARESRGLRKADRDYQGVKLATWGQRLRAGATDMVVLLPSVILIIFVPFSNCPAEEQYCRAPEPALQVWAGVAVAVIVAIKVYSRWYLQGTTGQSWGKRRHHLTLVSMTDKQPIGFRSAFVRGLAHLLDIGTLGIGYLLPLWDTRRQTLADKVMRTVVISEHKPDSSGSKTS